MPGLSPTGAPYPEKSAADQAVGSFARTLLDVLQGATHINPQQFSNPLTTLGPDYFPPFTSPRKGVATPDVGQLSLDTDQFQPQGRAQQFGNTLRDALGTAAMGMGEAAPKNPNTAELNALVAQAKAGSTEARDQLLQSMGKILWSVANRYARPTREGFIQGEPGMKKIEPQISNQDLYNTGVEKLINSIGGYKEGPKGFLGWAYPKVVGAMRAEALKGQTPIAISPDLLAAMRKLDAAEGRLRVQLGPKVDLTLDQLAKEANLRPDVIARIRSGQIQSIPATHSLEQLTSRMQEQEHGPSFDKILADLDPGTERYMAQQPAQPGAALIKTDKTGILGDVYRNMPASMKAYIEASQSAKNSTEAAAKMGVPLRTYQRNLQKANEALSQAVQQHQASIEGGSDVGVPSNPQQAIEKLGLKFEGTTPGLEGGPELHWFSHELPNGGGLTTGLVENTPEKWDELYQRFQKPISGASSGAIPPSGKRPANFEELSRVLDQTAGRIRQPNIPEPDPNIIRQLENPHVQDRPTMEDPGNALGRAGYRSYNYAGGPVYDTGMPFVDSELGYMQGPPIMSIKGEAWGLPKIKLPTPQGPDAEAAVAGGLGDWVQGGNWIRPTSPNEGLTPTTFSDYVRSLPTPLRSINIPRYQENMLGRANDRIDRLNQSNQRWGMPPIPYESEMAPLTPRAYNAPVGVNAPPSGMSNLKDAKAAAAQKAIIEQMLEGKNP